MIEALGLVGLVLASAFFAGSELAVTMANTVRIRTMAEAGSRRAAWALRLLAHPERAIVVCLVGNTLVNIAIPVVARQSLLRTGLPETAVEVLVTIAAVPVLVLCGEVFPKAVSQNYPNRIVVAATVPLLAAAVILSPLLLLAWLVAAAARRLARADAPVLEFASREELKQLMGRAGHRDQVDPQARDLIYRIFEFWKSDPRTWSRPVASVPHVTADMTVREAKRTMRERGLSRVVVLDRASGRVLGVVNATRLLGSADDVPLEKCVLPPVQVDPTAGLDRLLSVLQRSPSQMAVVQRGERTEVVILDDLIANLLGPEPTGSRPASAA